MGNSESKGMRLSGKVAVVTGVGSGIGRSICLTLAREGAKVVGADLNNEAGTATVEEVRRQGGQAVFVQADVSKAAEVARVADATRKSFGGIVNILVNNVGLQGGHNLAETTEEEWDSHLDVNVKSAFLVTKALLPDLLAGAPGSVINISSGAGIVGLRERTAYCAAKFAVIGLTKAMALDYGGKFRVNAICPGMIDTGSSAYGRLTTKEDKERFLVDVVKRTHAVGRIGTPDDIANAVLFLASEESSFVTGAALSIDGGYTAQ